MDVGTEVRRRSGVVESTMGSLRGVHQQEGVRWMCGRESDPGAVPSVAGGILADEMGLGKTHQVVALMRLRPMQTLIVTSVAALMQWQEVIATRLGRLPLIVRGGENVVGEARVVLTTYSMFQREDVRTGCFWRDWGRIVLDEAHFVRNPKGHAFRALSKLTAAHRWALTGTPVHNTVRDLRTLVGWLGAPGLAVDAIRSHLLLRRTNDAEAARSPELAIPALVILDSVVVMSGQERLGYEEIERAGAASCSSSPSASFQSHIRMMEAILRCRQACTHFAILREAVEVAWSRPETECTDLHLAMRSTNVQALARRDSSSKVMRLVDLVSMHTMTEKSLVFCDWCSEIDLVEAALVSRLGVRVLRYQGSMGLAERQSVLSSFASMEGGTVLVMQVQCGGTGLNIQSASRVYMMRPAWNPCVERQAIARAHRTGQTRPVVVTRLVAADTIDVRCQEIQARKTLMIDSVLLTDQTPTLADLAEMMPSSLSTCTRTR